MKIILNHGVLPLWMLLYNSVFSSTNAFMSLSLSSLILIILYRILESFPVLMFHVMESFHLWVLGVLSCTMWPVSYHGVFLFINPFIQWSSFVYILFKIWHKVISVNTFWFHGALPSIFYLKNFSRYGRKIRILRNW